MLAFAGLICCVFFVNLNALPADYMILPRMFPPDMDAFLNSDTMLRTMPAPMENGTFEHFQTEEFPPNLGSLLQVAPPYLPVD